MRSGLLSALALVSGCVAQHEARHIASPPEAATEAVEPRFRAVTIDATLPDVDAIGYEIDLRVDGVPGQESYTADVKGSYVATRDLQELVLDLEGNVVDDVEIGGRPVPFHRDPERHLVITLPRTVAAGATLTSRVRYHDAVLQADHRDRNDFSAFGGLYVREDNIDHRRIFSTLAWPYKARRWLPLRDHPRDGAMVAMNLTFPRSFTVLANGANRGIQTNSDGSITWHYEALTPMPAYDFHLSAYEDWSLDRAESSSGIPISTYLYASAHQSQRAVFGDLPAALDFYERSFGPYRWGTLTFIEEPIFGGAMEHATVVSMDETLFRDLPQTRAIAVHELAHHWSGNLVRIRTWNDFWLSEGFADYLAARFLAAHDGPAAKKKVLRDYLRAALLRDDAKNPHAVRPASSDPEIDVLGIFDATSYQKGALVLHTLERVVGEEALTTFLRGWFERHAFAAVTTEDFEKELAAATHRDLEPFFAGFVHGLHHPELRVTYALLPGGDVELRVEQLQTKGPENGFTFPLDVDLVDAEGHRERIGIDVTERTTRKRIHPAHAPTSMSVDDDESLLGAVVCGASSARGAGGCKEGFVCRSGAVSVCLPR